LEFNIPFQHKKRYQRRKVRAGNWKAIPTKERKASNILTSTLAAFLFSHHPKRERDRVSFKLLRYRLQQGETTITPQDKTKSNMTKTGMHPKPKILITQNQHTQNQHPA